MLLFPWASVWENTRAWVPHFSIAILNGTSSLRAPILFCGDVPVIKQLNYKTSFHTLSSYQLLPFVYIISFLLDLETNCHNWTRRNDLPQLGRRYFLFFRARCTSFHIPSPVLTFFLCFLAFFQSYRSLTQVFGRTLVQEFHIFYSHTEWSLLASLNDNGENILLNEILKTKIHAVPMR